MCDLHSGACARGHSNEGCEPNLSLAWDSKYLDEPLGLRTSILEGPPRQGRSPRLTLAPGQARALTCYPATSPTPQPSPFRTQRLRDSASPQGHAPRTFFAGDTRLSAGTIYVGPQFGSRQHGKTLALATDTAGATDCAKRSPISRRRAGLPLSSR